MIISLMEMEKLMKSVKFQLKGLLKKNYKTESVKYLLQCYFC